MRVALRIEVNSLRGLRHGVPNLMRLLSEYQIRASFYFPLGYDHAGRALRAAWRERHRQGWAALTYGTLRSAPELSDVACEWMTRARQYGHDVGVHGWSPVLWRRLLAHADDDWVAQCLDNMRRVVEDAGLQQALAFASPGWQIHPALLAALRPVRFTYTSMTRGRYPYRPFLQGARGRLPELPTTLPTVDELLAQPGVDAGNVHQYLYAESQHVLPAGHVFAASAEREGIEHLELMEKLLVMWKGQDGSVRALADLVHEIDTERLPSHQVGWGRVDGSDAYMAIQSVQVPV